MTTVPATADAIPNIEPTTGRVHADKESRQTVRRIIAALLGGVLLITALLARLIFEDRWHSDAIAFVAAAMLGVPLVIQALRDVFLGETSMNELAAIGVVAAFGSEQFLVAGAIAFFMIVSTLIETRTAQGARRTIESLLRLTPTRASRLGEDGTETQVEAAALKPGDVVRVRPGDNIPGDGTVITGYSTVNQANITGESIPADKNEHDEVFGGTTNLTGVLDVRITKAGKDTTLGRVQELVLTAAQSKTPTQRLADTYAKWHTPVVLMVAVVVFAFSPEDEAINRFIALLVIASPSSIILATPTAMVAALSASARLGILVKNVLDFERVRNVTALVFDKTGTITTGKLSVTRLGPNEGVEPAELLTAAASVEQNSQHPTARAVMEIARKARVTPATVTDFEESGGRGVVGNADGEHIVVGRQTFLADHGITGEPTQEAPEGLSLLYVARGGRLLGWIGLEDKTRPDAAKAMDDLRKLGVNQLVMVTGDRWSVARRVAAEMHCTDVQAEVLPAEKLQVVDGLKRKGHTVAVIGDGVNDAPALAAGDLSIAMGAAGSDVAVNSASIALMNNQMDRIPFLVQLGRKTTNVILQGIGFSVAYIVVFGVLSAMGYIDPVLAAVLHMLASIIVVFNSARLVREGEHLSVVPIEAPAEAPTLTPQRV